MVKSSGTWVNKLLTSKLVIEQCLLQIRSFLVFEKLKVSFKNEGWSRIGESISDNQIARSWL